jgi:hypothetical protein
MGTRTVSLLLAICSLYSEPARSPHYAWAKDGEVILQVTAIGPTGNVPIPQKSQQ